MNSALDFPISAVFIGASLALVAMRYTTAITRFAVWIKTFLVISSVASALLAILASIWFFQSIILGYFSISFLMISYILLIILNLIGHIRLKEEEVISRILHEILEKNKKDNNRYE
jgi:hypothetical protein